MMDWVQNAGIMTKGGFIALAGLVLVFAVLILFFFSIRLLDRLGKKAKEKEDSFE